MGGTSSPSRTRSLDRAIIGLVAKNKPSVDFLRVLAAERAR